MLIVVIEGGKVKGSVRKEFFTEGNKGNEGGMTEGGEPMTEDGWGENLPQLWHDLL